MSTLKEIGTVLKSADKTTARVFADLRSIGERSGRMLEERDQAHAEISALASEISTAGSDPKRLDDLLENLARARQRFNIIGKNLTALWTQADTTIAPLSDLANASICLMGGFNALEDQWFSLPQKVTGPIYEAASKANLKLIGVER